MSTTINPVQTPVVKAPAFKARKINSQKFVNSVDKATRQFPLKELAKTDPEKAKILMVNDAISRMLMNDDSFVKKVMKFLGRG